MNITTLIKIKYVGRKPFAIDNVASSGKVWNGEGDVQEVTDRQARILLKYPDQWALNDEADQTLLDAPEVIQARGEDGTMVQLTADDLKRPTERMTKTELVAFAMDKWKVELDISRTKKELLDQVEELALERGEVL